LLPDLSTDAVARDLDLIREAIGDRQITYVGFSYGTLIGSLYADLYPDHIRAMVLDGAIDPALDLEAFRSGQANAFEHALKDFLADCSARASCAFHENGHSAKAFDALMASIEAKPLQAIVLNSRREIGPAIALVFGACGALLQGVLARAGHVTRAGQARQRFAHGPARPTRTAAATPTARIPTSRTLIPLIPAWISRLRPTSRPTPPGPRS